MSDSSPDNQAGRRRGHSGQGSRREPPGYRGAGADARRLPFSRPESTSSGDADSLLGVLQRLLAAGPCAYLVTDHLGSIVVANRLAEGILGLDCGRLLGTGIADLITPDDREALGQLLKGLPGAFGARSGSLRLATGGRPEVAVAVSRAPLSEDGRAGGELHWMLWSPNTLAKPAESVKLRAPAADFPACRPDLAEGAGSLLSVIDALPDATFVVDRLGKVVAWNLAIERMTGVGRAEVLGKTGRAYSQVLYGQPGPALVDLVLDRGAELDALWSDVRVDGDAASGERQIPALSGGSREAYHWVTASALRDAGGNVVAAVQSIRDVTERRRAESELEASRDRERDFRRRLQVLNEVSIEMASAKSSNELCRLAVVLGRSRLGFDRLGIWLANSGNRNVLAGSYGTDEQGNLRDERDVLDVIPDDHHYRLFLADRTAVFVRHEEFLRNHLSQTVGIGAKAAVPLTDGRHVVGYIQTDNLLRGEPITDQHVELLRLFAMSVGHLYVRRRADEELDASREAERAFREGLEALHRTSIALNDAPTLTDLCRTAVELGRRELGYDRVGLWLVSDGGSDVFRGTFGTDENGAIRDESSSTHKLDASRLSDRARSGQVSVVAKEDIPLYDNNRQIVGIGDRYVAPLWDGGSILGYIAVDNLLSRRPIATHQIELLKLFAVSVGHLYTRKKAEEGLRASEEAANSFSTMLQSLHQVNVELGEAQSVREFCRQVIVLGRERLGFDRLGLWFASPSREDEFRGSFGTDENGQVRDESGRTYLANANELIKQVVGGRLAVGFREDFPLYDDLRNIVGAGSSCVGPLWDGKRIIGYLAMDNLLTRRPITSQQAQLLKLYASSVGHLYTRKQAEEDLRKSEEDYRLLIETQSDLVVKMTPDRRILFASPSFCRTFGLSEQETVGTILAMDLHPEDVELTKRFEQEMRRPPYSGYGEHRVMTARGLRWMAWSVNGLLDKDGKLVSFVGVGRDITDRKREEELLRVSEFAISSASNAIVIADMEGRVNSVNRAFLEAWAMSSHSQAVGQPISAFLAEGQYDPGVSGALARRGSWSGERAARRADGTLFNVFLTVSIVKDKTGKPISLMASFLDMTEVQEMEKQVLEAGMVERRRIGQDLHDSLGQVLTGVAFLIKTLESNLARKSPPQAEEARRIARYVDESITLTRALARGLQPVKFGAGGLTQALEGLASDTADLYRISCSFVPGDATDVRDEFIATHLFHITQEAVSNAVRHGQASRITIWLGQAGDGMAKLSIADDGKGLEGEAESRGMGLRTMRYRAGVVGGSLDVDSAPGGGTVVSCTFRHQGLAVESQEQNGRSGEDHED